MEKIKIKLDSPELPDEKIVRYKNFEKLRNLAKIPGKPFLKSAKFIAGSSSVVIIAAIVSVVLYQVNNKNTNSQITPPDTTDPVYKVCPPIKDKDVPWEYYSLENNEKSDIVTLSGTVIHIPDNAFIDSEGNKIEPPLKIKYREFRNAVDFFRAGIPMNYDSCNTGYLFESAGMFEIDAEKKGKKVMLANDKTIDIDLLSATNESRFNFYAFDTTRGKWDYVGKDVIKPYSKLPLTDIALADTTCWEEKTVMPVKPILATKDKYLFKLNIIEKDFPELVSYKNILFQVDDRGNKFDKMLYSVRWEQITLKSSGQKGLYDLYLVRKDTSVNLKVIPVFDKQNYQQAVDKYQAELQKTKSINDQNIKSKQLLSNTEGMVNEIARAKGFLPSSIRSVTIGSLGIFNCDYPLPNFPNTITPQFVDNAGKSIEFKMLYIADISRNLLGTYMETEPARYKKGSENLMWILTKDGKIGIVDPVLFNDITENNKTQIVVNLLESAEGINKLYNLINT